jgi:hypothetical protein
LSLVGSAKPRRGRTLTDRWYVAFQNPDAAEGEYYVRNTRTFSTEWEAKQFAEKRLAEGCNVYAGTLNPHLPKRTIGPPEIEHWLNAN